MGMKDSLISCVDICLCSINKTKDLALYADYNRIEIADILDQPEKVLTIGIKSFVKPKDFPSFEIKLALKNIYDIYKKDQLECQKIIAEGIWKKYKAAKFALEDQRLRNDIWNKLHNSTGTYTNNHNFGIPITKNINSTITIYTKAEIDKMIDDGARLMKLTEDSWFDEDTKQVYVECD